MADSFKDFILSQKDVEEIKGKYNPIQAYEGLEEIDSIWQLSGIKTNLPIVFIKTKTQYFIGITLARQSSDLLVAIGRKCIRNSWKLDAQKYLIQYRFPKDLNSLKLIVYSEWTQLDGYKLILSQLIDIQNEFLRLVEKIVELTL